MDQADSDRYLGYAGMPNKWNDVNASSIHNSDRRGRYKAEQGCNSAPGDSRQGSDMRVGDRGNHIFALMRRKRRVLFYVQNTFHIRMDTATIVESSFFRDGQLIFLAGLQDRGLNFRQILGYYVMRY